MKKLELELKEQETCEIKQFWADHERFALAAVAKEIFSFFRKMQASGRAFLRGDLTVPSAKISPGVRISEENSHRFGQGPTGVKNGDLICVILSCDIPMVVRREDKSGLEEIIGPCYWQGVMYGEAIAALEKVETETGVQISLKLRGY
jgi:hypothetical protein